MGRLTHWEGEPADVWARRWPISGLEIYDELSSTNDRARELAQDAGSGWELVLAEYQTRGRGRGGKSWTSSRGRSLLFSLVVPQKGPSWNSLIPIRMGMAVAAGLERRWGLEEMASREPVELKWPNDILLGRRKVGGILCEGGGRGGLVAGVGINVSQSAADFPGDLQEGAGSLEMIWEGPLARGRLLGEILGEIRRRISAGGETLDPGELGEYARRDHLLGARVRSEVAGSGTGGGLTPEGHLVILRKDGTRSAVQAGSVTLVPGS